MWKLDLAVFDVSASEWKFSSLQTWLAIRHIAQGLVGLRSQRDLAEANILASLGLASLALSDFPVHNT